MGKKESGNNRFYLSRKLIGVVAIFIAAASLLVVLTNFSINLISAAADYHSLISRWNQKHYQAGIYLQEFTYRGKEGDYQRYLEEKKEQDRLKRAIAELFNTEPDIRLIFDSFDSEHIYPNELSTLVFTFRWFRNTKSIQKIEKIWSRLNRIDAEQRKRAADLQEEWSMEHSVNSPIRKHADRLGELEKLWYQNRHELMAEVGNISAIVKKFGLWISVILGILLVLIGTIVSVRANKSIGRWEQALNEKQILLSEIHHRVKNNLAVVSGMLELETMEDGDRQQALKDSRDRIKSMAMIHEVLYQSHSFSAINMQDYMQQLTEHLRRTYFRDEEYMTINTEVDRVSLNINQAVPLGLIVNEILNRVLGVHHEYSIRCTVTIQLRKNGNQVRLTITDGFNYLSVNRGSVQEQPVGSAITEALIKQLKAEVDYKAEDGVLIDLRFVKSDARGSSNGLPVG